MSHTAAGSSKDVECCLDCQIELTHAEWKESFPYCFQCEQIRLGKLLKDVIREDVIITP